jgi:hypothetical protein
MYKLNCTHFIYFNQEETMKKVTLALAVLAVTAAYSDANAATSAYNSAKNMASGAYKAAGSAASSVASGAANVAGKVGGAALNAAPTVLNGMAAMAGVR